jgi:DNA repair exonuclease SbcCD ATPase subunit
MIHLNGIGLTNVVSFKEAKVRLNENAITFVRGLNLDSDPAQPSGNGAGKSLLFSCPANVLYFSPPLAIKKKAKKELLGKGSSIVLDIKAPDGHEYTVEQTASKYKISRNGKDLELRTTPIAERFIREKLFPISDLMYYTTCYVSTQRPFQMQNDSDSDRLSHLSKIFQLDDYDHMRRFFLNKIGEVKESELKLQVLERELLEAKARLKKAKKTSIDKKELASLEAGYEVLTKQIASYVDKEFSAKSLLRNLDTLLTVERELDALRETYRSKKTPAEYAKYLKAQRKVVRAWDSYKSQMLSYTKTTKSLKTKIDELELPTLGKSKIQKKLSKAEEVLEELIEKQREYKEQVRTYKAAAEKASDLLVELKELGYSDKNHPNLSAKYDDEIAGCLTTLKLERLLKHTHEDDSTCPTCMSPVDVDNVRTLVKDAKKRLPKLQAAQAAQEVWGKYIKAKEALKAIGFDESTGEELTRRIASGKPLIEHYNAQLGIWEKHEQLTSMLSKVEKPKEPDEHSDTDLTLEQIDETIELCSDIIKNLEARNKLIESSEDLAGLRTVKAVKAKSAETAKELESHQRALKDKRKELSEISTKLDGAKAIKHELDVHTKQIESTQKKIDDLRPMLEDKRLFETLSKAYSTKGLKTIVANQICGLLEQNLNAYSNLIFNEPFSFSVVAQDSGLSMVVDRGNGHVSDVRSLSGAESNAFRMLFVLSLLPLLPDERRVNTLTLDEPCSHMDEISRTKFLNIFLPALAEVVPHIYVITPNAEDYCEGSHQWVIKKNKGKSTVIIDGSVQLPEPVADLEQVIKKAKRAARARKRK